MKNQKIHFIVPYPRVEAPSQRFRFEQYLMLLEQNGFIIHFHAFHSNRSWKRLYQPGKFGLKLVDLTFNFFRRWMLLFKLIGAKHIFIHREMAHIGPPVFEWILAKLMRKKYILDFDDAIWIPNYSAVNAKFQQLKCYWKTKFVIRWAHQVIVGNAYLANYAQQFNPNVEQIPTTIDTRNHHNVLVDQNKEKIVVGWTGTHSTMHYLNFIVPIIARLENEFSFEFHVISNKKPAYNLSSLVYKTWRLDTEIDDLSQFHIGIMPLVADQWSEGKCGFKALQYMSLGTATIVSPVGVNSSIVENGLNGLIAETEMEWEIALRQLLQENDLRKKMGQEARKTIEEKWSVEAWSAAYLKLFKVSNDWMINYFD